MLKIEIYNNGRILDIKATEVKKNKKSIYFINKNVVEFVKELQNEITINCRHIKSIKRHFS